MKVTKFRMLIHSGTETTREPSDGDEWDRGDTESYHTIEGCKIVEKGTHSFELIGNFKEGQTLYFVYALYDTGDSFGSDGNQLCELALLEHEEDAILLKEQLEKNNKEKPDDFSPIEVFYPVAGITEKIGVSTWKGYFESLNGFNVEPVVVSK